MRQSLWVVAHFVAAMFLAASHLPAWAADDPIYDTVPDLDGPTTSATVEWQGYDKVPDVGDDGENAYAKISPGSLFPEPSGDEALFNEAEQACFNVKINVMRLRNLAPEMVDDVQGYAAANDPTQALQPGYLKAMADKGLVSVPDTFLMACFNDLLKNKAGGYRKVGDPLRETLPTSVVKHVAQYLQSNHEKAQLRSQVLDNDPASAANAAENTGKTRYIAIQEANNAAERLLKVQPDPTAPPNNTTQALLADLAKKLTVVQKTMGLARAPNLDEARGLAFWQSYFEGREGNPDGDRAVGGYLDTPEVQIGADLLRYQGTNDSVLLDSNRTDLDFKPAERSGPRLSEAVHNWKSDRTALRLDKNSRGGGVDDPYRETDEKRKEERKDHGGKGKLAGPAVD